MLLRGWMVKVEYNPLRLTHPHLISQMVILTQSDFELWLKIILYFTNSASTKWMNEQTIQKIVLYQVTLLTM